jgi:hypothetical protein
MKSTFMKNKDINIDRYLIECNCTNPHHILVFDIDKEIRYVSVAFVSNYHESVFKRIRNVIKYILFKDFYYTSDSIILTENNIEDLDEMIKALKKIKRGK